MFGWGFADFFAKKTIDQIGDLTTLLWSQAVGVAPLVVVFAITRNLPAMGWLEGVYLVLFGITSALSYLPLYNGFGKGQLSLLSPIFASYAAVVVLISVFVFGESISAFVWIALAIVFAGVLVISTDPQALSKVFRGRNPTARAGVKEVVGALTVYSVWLVLLDRFLGHRDWVLFLLVIRTVSALTLVAYARITKREVAAGAKMLPALSLIGVCDVGAYSAVAYGFSASSQTGVIAVLSSTFSLVTLALAYVFLRERITTLQKLSAAAILGGIALVSVHP
jgi:drug/metabolite transporter (DMT)-like permease